MYKSSPLTAIWRQYYGAIGQQWGIDPPCCCIDSSLFSLPLCVTSPPRSLFAKWLRCPAILLTDSLSPPLLTSLPGSPLPSPGIPNNPLGILSSDSSSLPPQILYLLIHLLLELLGRRTAGWPLFSKVKNIEIRGLHIVPIDENKKLYQNISPFEEFFKTAQWGWS